MIEIKSDFELVLQKLPETLKEAHIYCIGDVHIGSAECDEKLVKSVVNKIAKDKNAYWVCIGDMMNCGIPNSKTNVLEEKIAPGTNQKIAFDKLFRPIANKLLGAVPGNHECRFDKATGDNPLRDVICGWWNMPDVYRDNAAFVKINLGLRADKQRQPAYVLMLSHGSTRAKHDKFIQNIDGIDAAISGHTHDSEYSPRGKLVVDTKNNCIIQQNFIKIVVNPIMNNGGYGLKGEYLPIPTNEICILNLSGSKKHMEMISRPIE